MSSHSSGGGSSTPPPPPPTTGSRGPREKLILGIKWVMFFTVITIFGLGVNFSAGGLKIIGFVIAGIVLIAVIRTGGSGGGNAPTTTGGDGTLIALLTLVAVAGVTILVIQQIQSAQRRGGKQASVAGTTTVTTSPSGVVEVQVVAYPGTNYTSFEVGVGTNMWWVVNHPTERVMYHFNSEKPEQDQEDWKDGPTRVLPRMPWAYTAHLRAKGLVAVPITVYLTPIR